MDSLDLIDATPERALSSPAARRNTEPIRQVLEAWLPARGAVLEIAAGTGQHAVAFAAAFPGLSWTPSDPDTEARASIAAWADQARLANLKPMLALDVRDPVSWPADFFDAVVCINMVHISPWAATEGLMTLAGSRLVAGGLLYLYGPYREGDRPLAPSNAAFDDSLKARDSAWGLREAAAVAEAAGRRGLELVERIEMPANNLSLIFRRT